MSFYKITFLVFLLFICDYNFAQTKCKKEFDFSLYVGPDSIIDFSLDNNIKFENAVEKAIGFEDQIPPGQYPHVRMYLHFDVLENGLLDSTFVKGMDEYCKEPYEEALRKFFCKIKKIDLYGVEKSSKPTRIFLFLKAWQESGEFRLYGRLINKDKKL